MLAVWMLSSCFQFCDNERCEQVGIDRALQIRSYR